MFIEEGSFYFESPFTGAADYTSRSYGAADHFSAPSAINIPPLRG